MSGAAHTPGPWKTGDCDGFIIWAAGFRATPWIECEPGPEAVSIANVECPGWARVKLPDFDAQEEWERECRANAYLIAAAPDYDSFAVEALPQLEVLHSTLPPGEARAAVWRVITHGRAALAKARGAQ